MIPIFLINLARHGERLERMIPLLQGCAYTRVAAIDGTDPAEFRFLPGGNATTTSRLAPTALACIASHRKALTLFLATEARYACILEDDLIFSPEFASYMADDDWVPPSCDVVKIETMGRPVLREARGIPCRDRQLTRLHSIHKGGAAYVVSREGARKLLAGTQHPKREMDVLLFAAPALIHGLDVLQMDPALCRQLWSRDGERPEPALHSSIEHARDRRTPLANQWRRFILPPTRLFRAAKHAVIGVRQSATRAIVALK